MGSGRGKTWLGSLLGAALGVAASLVAPARPGTTAGAAASTGAAPAVVQLGLPRGLFPAIHVAHERGYFAEQGLDVRLQEFASGAELLPALATGELDAAAATPNAALMNALARDVRLALVLDGGHYAPGASRVPLVARGAGVSDLADLRGRRVANNSTGVITEWVLERALASAGLSVGDVDTVLLPFPDMLPALAGGSVDAAILPEPFGTIAEERGLGTVLAETSAYLPGAQAGVIAYTPRLADERAAVGQRWAVAYLRGARDYLDAMEHGRDRAAIVAIAARAAGLEPRLVEQAGYFPIQRDGRVNAASTLAMLDWLVERGYVPRRPPAEMLLNTAFADYARETLDRR